MTIIDSVCEAEYITASDVAKEAVWLQKFLRELGMAPSLDGPILVYYDSTGAITQAKELRSHHRTKHILWCYHLMRENMERGDINLIKIDEKKNMTDTFTKALKIKEFNYCK